MDLRVLLIGCFLGVGLYDCSGDVDYTPPAGSTEMAVTQYSFGKMVVDGTEYTSDIVISSGRIIKSWSFDTASHIIEPDDVVNRVTADISTIIIGTGYHSAASFSTPAMALFDEMREKGIEVFVLSTAAAVRRFNESAKSGLLVFFHLNC